MLGGPGEWISTSLTVSSDKLKDFHLENFRERKST